MLRTSLWPVLPAWLVLTGWALRGAGPTRSSWWRHEWTWHLGLILAWPALFFASSPVRHAKLLAYVPGFGWLTEPLGYRAIVTMLPQPASPGLAIEVAGAWALVLERYEGWLPLAGVALGILLLRWVPSRPAPSVDLRGLALVAGLAVVALLGPMVTQPLRLKTVVGYANQSVGLLIVVLAVLVVAAWRSGRSASPVARGAERTVLALTVVAAVVWPTLSVMHPLLPEDPRARPLVQLRLAAHVFTRLIPRGEPPVFLAGVAMPLYLAGVPVSARQVFDLDILAPDVRHQALVDRMGLIGPAQVDAMLGPGGSARTAVIVPDVLEHYRPTRRSLVERIEGHLEARYIRLGRVVAYPWSVMEVWRR